MLSFLVITILLSNISCSKKSFVVPLTPNYFGGESPGEYTIPTSIGSGDTTGHQQMLMDTGSSWIYIKTCCSTVDPIWSTTNCPEYYFNSDNSNTFHLSS